eukprot:TRINITY_DN3735_c0_g2_i2.p1 TRINITY_DN3735_c0_g2~~TRINITY_DN3735_c0_g2_i2.p1  ORF type:complete len:513 (-),score=168.28 TRINITY_DN3735_c0_g2_i2:1403-2941(-)
MLRAIKAAPRICQVRFTSYDEGLPKLRSPNGRFKDPMDIGIKPELPDYFWEEGEPAPLKTTDVLKKTIEEFEKYTDEWKFRQLPLRYQDFIIRSILMYDQAKQAETQNLVETNTPPYKHYDRMFLQPRTRRLPKSPPLALFPDPAQPGYEDVNYYSKQERLVIEHNYNYEQFRDYTKLLKKRQDEDKKEQLEEQKLMKYVRTVKNRETDNYLKRNHMTRSMLVVDPQDEDLDISNVKVPGKRKPKKTINQFRAGTLDNYEAWRSTDRNLFQMGREKECKVKLQLIPNLLVKAFGWPSMESVDNHVSGEYVFEDTNLDLFVIYEYDQTTLSHEERIPIKGVYKVSFCSQCKLEEKRRKLRKKEYLKVKNWPSPGSFWESKGPQEFRLVAAKYADIRLFRQWLSKKMEETEAAKETYDERLIKKYGPFNYYNKYDENYELNKDFTVLKHDYRSFLTEEELKTADLSDLKNLELPKMIDLEKAEKLFVPTREELVEKAQKEEELKRMRESEIRGF